MPGVHRADGLVGEQDSAGRPGGSHLGEGAGQRCPLLLPHAEMGEGLAGPIREADPLEQNPQPAEGKIAKQLADALAGVRQRVEQHLLAGDYSAALHLLAAGQPDAASVAYNEAIDLTLTIDDTLSRSTFFGSAFNDLNTLAERQPEGYE